MKRKRKGFEKGTAKLRGAVKQAYQKKQAKHFESQKLEFVDRHLALKPCQNCGARCKIVDVSMGSIVCTNCGIEDYARMPVDSFSSDSGEGQWSLSGNRDTLNLDKLSRCKYKDEAQTTKAYKDRLKRRAHNGIEERLNDERQVAVARDMFAAYSDEHDKITKFDLVLEACVASAKTYMMEQRGQYSIDLKFPCKICSLDFTCEKDRRLHTCINISSPEPHVPLEHSNPMPDKFIDASHRMARSVSSFSRSLKSIENLFLKK